MSSHSGSPLRPRNGHTLVVGIVARISGCVNQKELSLEDQIDHARQVVAELNDGPLEVRVIATKGKGERLDRPELEQIRQELLKGELDLLVMEDMGRLVRGVEAVRLFGLAVDHGSRAISPNDRVDTIEPTWEEDALAACRDHVAHNAHTSRRLKHKLMNRFLKFGGATARPIAGYDVPPDAKTYADWRKQEDATPVIAEGMRRLRHSKNCEAVAEYFDAVPFRGGVGFPPGPYCRRKRWDGKMVRRFYLNRLLGGAPGRGFRHTVKHHGTGRRRSVKNSDGPQFISFPHLAHVDLAELDGLNAELGRANGKLGCKGVGRTPRRTRFPAGVATCWYCGRRSVWGGNGIAAHLMCSGAREWRCWCSVGYDGDLAVDRVLGLIEGALDKLDGYDEQLRDLVRAAHAGGADLAERWERLRREEAGLARSEQNVRDALKAYGPDPAVAGSLAELNALRVKLASERRELETVAARKLVLPGSAAELRDTFREKSRDLARNSREFNDLLRLLVPGFHVHLVRLADGGHPLPRAQVRLALDGLTPDACHVAGMPDLLTVERTVDLFVAPQRAAIRERAVALASRGFTQHQIAAELAVTQTAVGQALALDRLMRGRGLDSPYVLLSEPPGDYAKLRRHRNAKYRFEPLEGYRPPPLMG